MSKEFNERFTTYFVCESCSTRHAEEYDATKCCPPEVTEAYECVKCKEIFYWESDAENHLETQCMKADTPIPEPSVFKEMYFENVLLTGNPTLGQWAYEFAVTQEVPGLFEGVE